jgi:hypothetical protein
MTNSFRFQTLTDDDSLTHWRRLTNSFGCQRLTNCCVFLPLTTSVCRNGKHSTFPLLVAMQLTCTQQYLSGERIHVTIRPRLLGKHATQQYRVASVSMKPIVVLGMAQPYPGYGCEQVTIVASLMPDTIVAFGQTRHSIKVCRRCRKPMLPTRSYYKTEA